MRSNRRISLILACVIVAACDPSGETIPVGDRVAIARLPESFPSVLPSPDTADSTQFYDFVHTLSWVGGHERWRCTDSDIACYFGFSDSVLVRVDASEGSHLVGAGNIPPNGIALARVLNIGNKKATKYNFKRQNQGFEYYFVVYPDPDTAPPEMPIWKLMETDPTHKKSPVDSGTYYHCWDHPASGLDSADFRRCGETAMSRPASGMTKSSVLTLPGADRILPSLLLAFAAEKPPWISCPAGCCEYKY